MTSWPSRHIIGKRAVEEEGPAHGFSRQSCFQNKPEEEEVQTDKGAGRGAGYWRERCFSVPVQSTGKDPALQT